MYMYMELCVHVHVCAYNVFFVQSLKKCGVNRTGTGSQLLNIKI